MTIDLGKVTVVSTGGPTAKVTTEDGHEIKSLAGLDIKIRPGHLPEITVQIHTRALATEIEGQGLIFLTDEQLIEELKSRGYKISTDDSDLDTDLSNGLEEDAQAEVRLPRVHLTSPKTKLSIPLVDEELAAELTSGGDILIQEVSIENTTFGGRRVSVKGKDGGSETVNLTVSDLVSTIPVRILVKEKYRALRDQKLRVEILGEWLDANTDGTETVRVSARIGNKVQAVSFTKEGYNIVTNQTRGLEDTIRVLHGRTYGAVE